MQFTCMFYTQMVFIFICIGAFFFHRMSIFACRTETENEWECWNKPPTFFYTFIYSIWSTFSDFNTSIELGAFFLLQQKKILNECFSLHIRSFIFVALHASVCGVVLEGKKLHAFIYSFVLLTSQYELHSVAFDMFIVWAALKRTRILGVCWI